MLLTKLKLVALAFLLVSHHRGRAGFVAKVPARQAGKPRLQELQAGKPDLHETAAQPADVSPKPGSGRMYVTGRVHDQNGKPVPGATIMVYAYTRDLAAETLLLRC